MSSALIGLDVIANSGLRKEGIGFARDEHMVANTAIVSLGGGKMRVCLSPALARVFRHHRWFSFTGVLVAALGFCAPCASRAAIRVEKPRKIFLHGDAAIRVRLHVTPRNGQGDGMVFDITSPGYLELSMYSNAEYYENQAHTLVAFNVKQNNANRIHHRLYLIAQGTGDQVLVIRNLGQRVAQLCSGEQNDQFDEESATVDKIVGNTVYVSTVASDDIYSVCHVTVHVSSDGKLTLLSYAVKKEPLFSQSKVK